MKVLLLSNMYSNGDSYFGSFVKEQVDDLENSGEVKPLEVIKVVRTRETKISYLPFFIKAMYYLLFKHYHLIHAHYGFHSALPALIFKSAPLIVTFHGTDAQEEPNRNIIYYGLQKLTVRKATHIIAVSCEIKRVLIELGARAKNISIISCGVDTSIFKPNTANRPVPTRDGSGTPITELRKELGLPNDKAIVLFVGLFSYRKGIDIVYNCAHSLPDVMFILIGKPTPNPQPPIPQNCMSFGSKPHTEIPKWLNAADIFLFPSRSEGMPVALLEALSCGIPAITTNVGGIPEVMENGKTGWIVNIEDIDEIISRIKQLLDNQEIRTIMGEYARKIILNRFDKHIITAKIKKVYEDVIHSH
ncbi:MAG: glycosyltransferase [Candidatus Stahlbacteria bacterium]|nr:glycosyltransferase [Candidatus Stahlbacteria bacterium]